MDKMVKFLKRKTKRKGSDILGFMDENCKE
jgi:hypothetical protein